MNFFSAYLFQECQEKFSSAINEVNIDLLSKSLIFSQKARAHFCSDSFKTKNACNIHNSEFACKKSASNFIFKESGLYPGQTLILEVKGEDGEWPRDKIR